MNIIGTQTEENLLAAMKGESFARTKYLFFAEKAKQENHPEVAEMFERLAGNETAHARVWCRYLDRFSETGGNLEDAMAGEALESSEMYPQFAQQAMNDGLPELAQLFLHVGDIERLHKEELNRALGKLRGHEEAAAPRVPQKVFACAQCGHAVPAQGEEPPYVCPVCGALGMMRQEVR